jgi:hypothetical protein
VNAPLLRSVLPSGLRRLCLHNTFNDLNIFRWTAPAVLRYLAMESGDDCLSSLKRITIVSAVAISWLSGKDEEAFERACERRGVTCGLVSQWGVNIEPEHG